MENIRDKSWYIANIKDSLSELEDTVILCAIGNIVANLARSNSCENVLFLDAFVLDYINKWG